ncbi:hypothetical protein MASR1M68_10120 [Elusimicrobiota bacterium]
MEVFRYSEPDREITEYIDELNIEHKIYVEDSKGERKRHAFKKESEKESFLCKQQYSKIYDVKYTMLGQFLRWTKGDIWSENAYIFFGCSFTFGDGLNDDQTLPYCFSKYMQFRENVLNYGVIGKSTNFVLNILNSNIIDRYARNAKNKHFVYSLISDQIMRNFNFPQYGRSDNWLYKDGKWHRAKQPFETVQIVFAKSFIFRKIFLPIIDESNNKFYEDYMINSLKEIRNLAKSKYNAKFTIIVWPSVKIDFKERLAMEKFDIIELPEYLEEEEYKIQYDDHPTAKTNEEIAKLLYEHIKKKNSEEVDNAGKTN